MFICDRCHEASEPRERMVSIPAGYRYKVYPKRIGVHPVRDQKKKKKDDPGGEGKEMTGILKMCPRCAELI